VAFSWGDRPPVKRHSVHQRLVDVDVCRATSRARVTSLGAASGDSVLARNKDRSNGQNDGMSPDG
jgi:hypothetical protein